MCLQPAIIDQRTDKMFALLHAARLVAAGHVELEANKHTGAGVLLLVEEVERDLNAFAAELKAACPERPAS